MTIKGFPGKEHIAVRQARRLVLVYAGTEMPLITQEKPQDSISGGFEPWLMVFHMGEQDFDYSASQQRGRMRVRPLDVWRFQV